MDSEFSTECPTGNIRIGGVFCLLGSGDSVKTMLKDGVNVRRRLRGGAHLCDFGDEGLEQAQGVETVKMIATVGSGEYTDELIAHAFARRVGNERSSLTQEEFRVGREIESQLGFKANGT